MIVIMDINVSGVKPITYLVYYRYKDEEHSVYKHDNYCAVCDSVVYIDKAKCFEIYTNNPINSVNINGVLKID